MLYQKRFLIAYYNKNDELLCVAENVNEFYEFYKQVSKTSKRFLEQFLSKIYHKKIKSKHIRFIDVFEKHNDVFSYEDEIFIQELSGQKTIKQKAQEIGLSEREYARKLQILNKI